MSGTWRQVEKKWGLGMLKTAHNTGAKVVMWTSPLIPPPHFESLSRERKWPTIYVSVALAMRTCVYVARSEVVV
jgi:hypothetical protein